MASFAPFRLPEYEVPRNAMLDFSPFSEAVKDYQTAKTNTARLGMEQERLNLAKAADQRQQESHADDRKTKLAQSFAGIGQMILDEKDPVRQNEMYQRLVASDPRIKDSLGKYLPKELLDDPVVASKYFVAQARGYVDPLDQRHKLAQIKAAEANADPTREFNIRSAEATKQGLQPGTPEFQQYVLTGKMGEKARQFSVSDITKLTEEGGKYASVTGFADRFKDDFAGYKSQGLGDTATWLGRNMPNMPGAASGDATAFWQEYDKYKNVVRNDLFGSALTSTEKEAFEKADINPGMDPKTIRANLAIQKAATTSALKKKASALIQAGYDPAVIAASYGVNLNDMGVTTQRMRGAASVPGTAPEAPKAEAPPAAVDLLRKNANNPDVVRQFEQKYGARAARQYLQQAP